MADTRKASSSSTKHSFGDYQEMTHTAESVVTQSQDNTGESEPTSATNTVVFAGKANAEGSAQVVVNTTKMRTLNLIRDLKE